MQQGSEQQSALRTRVYIDGYNLYYGCLKRSLDKWLDPRALVECIRPTILYEQNGEPVRYRFQTPTIKYFTAPILEAFARSDDSVACQTHYHAALEGQLRGDVQIIKGYHDARPARAHRWEEGKAARECDKVNAAVAKHVHWTRKHIRDDEFARSQLSHWVPCKGSVVHKPLTWYPRPDLLTPIYEEAKRVKHSAGAARKWLNQPCALFLLPRLAQLGIHDRAVLGFDLSHRVGHVEVDRL